MFGISTKKQDDQEEEIIESNEFTIAADRINQRIALSERRIRDEIDALLNDLKPKDFEIETKVLRDYGQEKIRGLITKCFVGITVKL